jgi:hypothetical protein
MLQLYFLWFFLGIFSGAMLVLDNWWQPSFRTWFLKTSARIREFLQHENRPRFHIDRRVAQAACRLGAVPLLLLGFVQAIFFAGSYKGLIYPIPPLLFAYILVSYDAENFKVEAEIAERGYRAEEKIDELLQPFVAQGGIISQPYRQEGNRLEDIDAFLSMPSGDGFAISVKNIGAEGDRVRVSFDLAQQRFRYRRGRRSGRKYFSTEPTLEHKNLVGRFLSDGLIPSCRLHLILAFPSHVELNIHEASPVEEIRGHRFLKFNGVWVISDQDLALLIEALHHA